MTAADDRALRPILKDALHETAINQFLAQCYRCDQGKKGEAFHVVLRKKFQRQLRENSVDFFRLRDEPT